MSKKVRLNKQHKQFFENVAAIIFSNPFSVTQQQIEDSLGEPVAAHLYHEYNKYAVLLPKLRDHVTILQSKGVNRIQDVHENDQQALTYAYLFEIYHQYLDELDTLIQRQFKAGVDLVSVPFAKRLLEKLEQVGLDESAADRYFALFYQIRRAFYFIAENLVGDSPCMIQLRHALWNNVFTSDVRLYEEYLWNRMEDFSTLLLGATGSGKGSAAAAIGRSGLIPFHRQSNRFRYSFMASFVAINLSEFPETLIESELFGHRKGAFTGAIDNFKGIFERCNSNGSLFLDEIGDVSVPTQIKLLNVLQNRIFTPVGSHEQKRFEGRVIAATNRPLDRLMQQGMFREDFYYRLSSDTIRVPSLQQRLEENPDELRQITALLLSRMTGNLDRNEPFADKIYQIIKQSIPKHYHWPGNVRQLEQTIRAIIINGKIEAPRQVEITMDWHDKLRNGELSAQQLLSHYCKTLYQEQNSYESVAEITGLDRRTVKKHIEWL
jgi:DNA-binding NtrC family response regulator